MYLARGFTRAEFCRRCQLAYSTVDKWDVGTACPSLSQLLRVAAVLDVSISNLCWGHAGRHPAAGREPELTDADIRLLLSEIDASPRARKAFADHLGSDGRYQRVTRSYVQSFVNALDQSAASVDEAITNALVAKSLIGAAASGARPVAPGVVPRRSSSSSSKRKR
jgi:transcriptional regulator with XRE-family HTH domain